MSYTEAKQESRLDVSEDALELYSVLDPLIHDEWQPFSDPTCSNTRTLLHELGSKRLLASYTTPNTNIHWISRWQNRYPATTVKSLLFNSTAISKVVESYGEWTRFSFDHFGMVLRNVGITTEAFFQINNAFLHAVNLGIIETRLNGTEIRTTDDVLLRCFVNT